MTPRSHEKVMLSLKWSKVMGPKPSITMNQQRILEVNQESMKSKTFKVNSYLSKTKYQKGKVKVKESKEQKLYPKAFIYIQ